MFTALLLPVSAFADTTEPWADLVDDQVREAWSDGLTHRAPTDGGFARVDGTAVVAESSPMFGSVTAGGAVPVDQGLSLGATVTLSGFQAELATGPSAGLQTVGAELWLVTTWDHWRHGAAVGYYDSVGDPSSWYLRHPSEGGQRYVGRYVGWLDGRRTDLSLETRLGFGETFAMELTASGALVTEITPWLAASAGAEVGFSPLGTVMAGLHLRPVAHTEVGLTLATPFPLFSSLVQPELQPGAVVKGWF